jgi:oxygen-independent coproporphyrinogen III oxidase
MTFTSEVLPWLVPRAAYLHVPFCAHRCGYCDFAVTAGRDRLIDLYVEAIAEELSTLGSPKPVDTIFVGGGTPTYLSADQLAHFLISVNRWLPLRSGGEFSIEATPETITADRVTVLQAHGVTRVSLGVQSFRAELLMQLDRVHTPEHVGPAIDRIRKAIDDISLDMIFGVPTQTVADWEADLTQAISFAPNHLSTYGLTYEKGTPLWKARERGRVVPIAEDEELAMYELAMDRLSAEGFEQYEISSYARPGRRCRHNETYWANDAYYGFGVGAARFVQGRRELNRRNTEDYIRRVLAGESATFQTEELLAEEAARETIAVQLRRAAGVVRRDFRERTGFDFDQLTRHRASGLAHEGLIEDDGVSVRLTRRGRCVADALVINLVWR